MKHNMNKLYDDLIKQLIEIGRSEIIPSIPDSEFSYLREGQWQRSRYPDDCDSYSNEELKLLYKGLVLCEKHFEWFVGSATNTAWVLRNIEARLDYDSDYDEIKELYDFGFANRGENPYAPTGSQTHSDCNTYEEFEEVVHQKLNNIAKHDARMLREQKESRRMKAIKKELQERRAKEHAERKKERDKKLIITEYEKTTPTLIMTTETLENGIHTEYFDNGRKKLEGNLKNDNWDGKLTDWYENGKIKSETNYKDGKFDGTLIYWYEEEAYYQGFKQAPKWNGKVTERHHNGQIMSEQNWKNGKLNGKLTYWYDNGQIREEANYKDFKRAGKKTEWYDNGQIKEEAYYKDNKLFGKYTWWNFNGKKFIEEHYKDGKLNGKLTRWHEIGVIKEEAYYKDDKLNGKSTIWRRSGEIEAEAIFKNGKCVSGNCDYYKN